MALLAKRLSFRSMRYIHSVTLMVKSIRFLLPAFLILGILFVAAWFSFQKKELETSVNVDPNSPSEPRIAPDETVGISPEYPIRPNYSRVKDFKNTLELQRGVRVRYGDGWTAKRNDYQDGGVSGGLFKTVNGRSYVIGFQENNLEYLSAEGAYANGSLKAYAEIQIHDKPHFIITSSVVTGSDRVDYAYISSCPVKATEACSLPLKSTPNLLFVMLRQNVPNAQYPVELDFTREDDQQILAEFAEIASTLQY